MLLDRKRINKWARVVAGVMAAVFALSFVFLGVGSGLGGLGGLDWSSIFGQSSNSPAAGGPEDQIKAYEATLAQDPANVNALLGIATQYQQLGTPAEAAPYLERAAEAAPTRADILLRLGALYVSPEVRDYPAAVRALNKATELQPGNADAFLQLGVAQRGAGNVQAAILAWNRYLELAPEGDMAQTIRAELQTLATQSTEATATVGATTTTVAPTTTTAG